MAQRVTWTLEAAADLQAIAEYIERDSPRYASVVVDKITTLTRSLPEHPWMGRKVPELEREDIRERFVFAYRIIYQIRERDIVVVNIVHGRQQYEPNTTRFD